MAVDEGTGRVFAASPQSVTVFDAGSGAILRSLNRGSAGPFAVAVDARAHRAFVLDGSVEGFGDAGGPNEHNPDGSVTVLDTRSGAGVGDAEIGIGPSALAVDERTGRVFVANAYTESQAIGPIGDPNFPGSVSVLDARTGAVAGKANLPGELRGFGPRGQLFLSSFSSVDGDVAPGRLIVSDGRTGAALRTVTTGGRPDAPVIDERTGRAFVVTGDKAVLMLDASRL